jgi:hypothetical protein
LLSWVLPARASLHSPQKQQEGRTLLLVTICDHVSDLEPNKVLNLSLTSLGTKDAKGYVMEHKGRQVRLIDTPGFDDDEMSDADLLKIIGDFLGTLDVNGSTLAGTILLQPVTTNRVPGSEERRTRMIEKALGAPAMQNVILATTQWSKVVNKKEAQARVDERERNAAYWGWMKDNGARVVHHENTRSSARHIIGLILDNHVPVPLAMQIELAAHNFEMAFTSAGEYLISVLEETREILLQKLGKVRFKTTIPESDFSQLQEEMDELQGKLDNVEAEEIKMKASRVRCLVILQIIWY